MNTIVCFTVTMIVLLGLFPYKNNAPKILIKYTKSDEDIQYKTEKSGSMLYIKKCSDDNFVSPFNDIPLNTDQQDVFRAVIVMPKQQRTVVKEIWKSSVMNPIWNVNDSEFTLEWHYAELTQTWEDPNVIDPTTNHRGNNTLVNVVVFSEHLYDCGAVIKVKIVGGYPMIVYNTDMTNWQMIAVDAKDPIAATVNNIEDFSNKFPGYLNKFCEWVKSFNILPGYPINKIFDVVDAPAAVRVVLDKHKLWKEWQEAERFSYGVCSKNTTLNNKRTLKNFSIPP